MFNYTLTTSRWRNKLLSCSEHCSMTDFLENDFLNQGLKQCSPKLFLLLRKELSIIFISVLWLLYGIQNIPFQHQ